MQEPKKLVLKKIVSILLFVSMFNFNVQAQNAPALTSSQTIQISKLKAKVEANPSNLEAHHAFIDAFKTNDHPALEAQYKVWIKQFPQVYTVPFVIGEYYVHKENPKATPFLLRASILKPEKAEVWSLLASDAALKNNTSAQQEYLKKAMRLNPGNAADAFSYADSFEKTDTLRHDSLFLEVARKFSNSAQGDQALYWLATNSTVPTEKIAYYIQLYNRKSYSDLKWYLSGMTQYFDLLLKTNPDQAFELGLALILEGKTNLNLWKERIKVADAFLKARKLLTNKNPKEALSLLSSVNLGSLQRGNFIDAKEDLALFKAETADSAKQTNTAYDSIAVLYSIEPTEGLHTALFKYGSKLGMDSNSVTKSIVKLREAKAEEAINFSLENYQSTGKTSLSDKKAKLFC